jgi:hypothetical protein
MISKRKLGDWLKRNHIYCDKEFKGKGLCEVEGNGENHDLRFIYNFVLLFQFTVVIMIGIYSAIFAIRRLLRPGFSVEIRTRFLKRHLFYVVGLILLGAA